MAAWEQCAPVVSSVAALDPVLVPVGFQGGQYGEGGDDREGDAQIIFCAAHEQLSDRHPRLPQADRAVLRRLLDATS